MRTLLRWIRPVWLVTMCWTLACSPTTRDPEPEPVPDPEDLAEQLKDAIQDAAEDD